MRPDEKTNVLLVGSGGREHAIAWKILQSKKIGRLFVAPGNGGTQEFNIPIGVNEVDRLRDFAREKNCFTLIGPEAPLATGIVDRFESEGLPIFGPTADQARLETSKVYAKEFMKKYDISTSDFRVFSETQPAIDYAYRKDGKIVVKADGLASGKGVFVCSRPDEAERAIRLILEKRIFGNAGNQVIIEEKLEGREASFIAASDGKTAIPFGTAVDHKRAFDGDVGPNTGGMGAYSPAPKMILDQENYIIEKILNPTVENSEFRGFLYLGLMFDEKNSPKVLEFNARLGDPEAQAILPRLETDLLGFLHGDVSEGKMEGVELKWSQDSSCTVVMCSERYPENPKTGDEIHGIEAATAMDRVLVFHSGTVAKNNSFFTNGGRVLSVTGLGPTKNDAATKTYEGVSLISWRGERHRRDISQN
jgi:phosphoribosylamine---glycine ligase